MIRNLMMVVALAGAISCKKSDNGESRAASSTATKTADNAGVPDGLIAFSLGRKVGMLEMYAIVNKPSDGADALDKAQTLAAGLGISPPTMPGKDDHPSSAMFKEIESKKSKPIANAFMLGFTLSHALFGAMLGANVQPDLQRFETYASAANVPEAVWRAALAKLRQKPSADDIESLGAALTTYFKG